MVKIKRGNAKDNVFFVNDKVDEFRGLGGDDILHWNFLKDDDFVFRGGGGYDIIHLDKFDAYHNSMKIREIDDDVHRLIFGDGRHIDLYDVEQLFIKDYNPRHVEGNHAPDHFDL